MAKTSQKPREGAGGAEEPREAPRTRQQRVSETTYVVQMAVEAADMVTDAWADIATVTVSARASRKKVFGLALKESGVRPEVGGVPLRLRALDAASARVTEVELAQPEPQLRIG
jgi:hypothetical protein